MATDMAINLSDLNDFLIFFTGRFRGKFAVTVRLLIMYAFLLQHLFSLLQQLCTVGNGIFYMANVNVFCY